MCTLALYTTLVIIVSQFVISRTHRMVQVLLNSLEIKAKNLCFPPHGAVQSHQRGRYTTRPCFEGLSHWVSSSASALRLARTRTSAQIGRIGFKARRPRDYEQPWSGYRTSTTGLVVQVRQRLLKRRHRIHRLVPVGLKRLESRFKVAILNTEYCR